MIVNGYTVPDTLEEAQAMCARLGEQIKRSGQVASYKSRVLRMAVGMVLRARKALRCNSN